MFLYEVFIVSFSKRAFEDLNKYKIVINFDAKDEKDAENFIASLNVSDLIDHLEIEKGKSMNEIDIKDAKILAEKVIRQKNLPQDIRTMKILAITFATRLFMADPKEYEQYQTLLGEKDLAKLVNNLDLVMGNRGELYIKGKGWTNE